MTRRSSFGAALLALFANVGVVDASGIVTECNTKLPMSLSTVISDLEAEGVSKLMTACFLTSRGVTAAERASFFGCEDAGTTAFGTESGLCVALSPGDVSEVASTAVACGGNLVFYPNEVDLQTGEGLFDLLGPAMERILSSATDDDARHLHRTELIVVSKDPAATRVQLEKAAEQVMGNLVVSSLKKQRKAISTMDDVFTDIHYVSSAKEAIELLEQQASEDPAEAQSIIANTVSADFWQPVAKLQKLSERDLAAARQLAPAARKALELSLDSVKAMAEGRVVANFGDLCEAATKRALQDFEASSTPVLASSSTGKQIRANLKEELVSELADLAEDQLELLKLACFEEFKQDLSKARLGPTLENEMSEIAKKSVENFAKRSKNMPISASDVKAAYQAELKEVCAERLLAAKASGKLKPLPKKGVTIGLHWLLPKPFGNDYRQEPWMVHATDNLVYVPRDKLTDVNPNDVVNGDWRRKIVPSPSGNEMIYMQ
jgi:hypothetical protein